MVFSGLRLFLFYQKMVDSFDITWNATAVAFWGILESSLAAIIACLPALNQAMIKFVKKVYNNSQLSRSSRSRDSGTGSRVRSGSGARSSRFGISLFERTHIYRGPAKFVSYSADATTLTTTGGGTMRDYVELGDVNPMDGSKRVADNNNNNNTNDNDANKDQVLQRTANDSYPDITVERSYYITEERASDLEAQEEEEQRSQSTTSLTSPPTKPPKLRTFFRRPSSPTIPSSPAAMQLPSLPPIPPLPMDYDISKASKEEK
ncbi:hypothetical protein H072_1511 [Dactylellina haptotyla CBS 200.50]|uniref:Uncharacterized protein n=1 Tax=Dactylellina haptotyla (strain CBS 200.50) TaxID=1284197 RepID=S8AU52_DACHA|nr:hypothetical protein H072_1511 [Dactylellina haptotyla CBS 200.50]